MRIPRSVIPTMIAALALPLRALGAEPTKGECIAANEEGQDLRSAGKIGAASERFSMCSSRSCPAPVRSDCVERAQEAARAQPTVRFVVKDGRGTVVPDVTLRIDGTSASKVEERAVAVDPGNHRFEFDGAGAGKLTKTIDIVAGQKDREELVVLEAPAGAVSSEEDDLVFGLGHRTVAYVAGGTSAVLLVVGGVAGLVANSKYHEAIRSCDAPVNGQRRCEGAGLQASDSANSLADVSTAAFVTGAVLAAASIVLFAIAPPARNNPRSSSRALSVSVGSTWLQVTGAW